VYLAEDLRLRRSLAVKVVSAGAHADASAAERVMRFQREARAASQLNHPNIVAIHDSGTERGLLFIVMEFVAGRTLRALINDGQLPDARTVLDVASQWHRPWGPYTTPASFTATLSRRTSCCGRTGS
jgi:serine/threonine protein kinase